MRPRILHVLHVDQFPAFPSAFISSVTARTFHHLFLVGLSPASVGPPPAWRRISHSAVHSVTFFRCDRGFTGLAPSCRRLPVVLFLARFLNRVRPDLVSVASVNLLLLFLLARRLACPGSSVPVVATITGWGQWGSRLSFSARPVLTRAVRAVLYSLLDAPRVHVVCQNSADAAGVLALCPTLRSRVNLIAGHGFDPPSLSECRWPVGPLRFAFVGRASVSKGLPVVRQALRVLRARGVPAACSVFVQPDPFLPAPVFPVSGDPLDWRARAVHPLDIWREHHALVFPSTYGEGLPRVIVEAASYRRAVITTDWPGCRDALPAPLAAVVVPPESPGRLAEAMQFLYDSPYHAESLGAAARDHAVDHLSSAVIRPKVELVWRSALSSS